MSMFVITAPAKACHFSLKIEKMGPSEVIVNKEFTYKIVVHNGLWEGYGYWWARDVRVKDIFPDTVEIINIYGDYVNYSNNDNTYYFFLGTICGGGSKTIFIKAKVTNCAPDTITNTAEIYHFIGTDDDSDDNIATCTTHVICPDPSIEIEKKIWNGTAWVNSLEIDSGEIMLFNLSIYNSGNEALKNINITDYLPDGLEYVEGSATIEPIQWGHNLTWLLYGCHCCHEGLSHGYWKTHTDKWHFYCTDTCLNDIFDIPDEFSIGDDSFLDALNFGGGSDLEDAAKLLLQQAVAALLNAVDDEINYPLNVTEIINQVDDALDSMDRDTILDLKDLLDEYNNLGCCDDSEDCNGCCHCDCKFLPGEHIYIEFEAIAEGCEENINLVVAKGEGKCSHVEVIDNDTADIFIVCNHPPVANDDYATIYEDSVNNSIDVLANDSDIDGDELAIISMTAPSHGTAYIDGGMIYYTPDENYYGSDEFNYTISDGFATDTATVHITILPVNDAPVALNDSATTDEDKAVFINVSMNDYDVDGTIDLGSIVIVDYPSHGSLEIYANGTVKYTPDANYYGNDEFNYTIKDNEGGVSNVANVVITILPVNDPPVANDDCATVEEDSSDNQIDVLANDTDVDGDSLEIISVSSPSHGTVYHDGNYVYYTPDANYYGDDSFTYTITDGIATDTATVYVTILAINDSPIANDDYVITNEDTPVVIDVLANDTDVEDGVPELNAIISQPSHGIATINPNGTITYEPNANYYGEDSFVYEVIDSDGATDTATVYITVIAIPKPIISIEKIDYPDPVKAGEILQYVINVSNSGDADANSLTISDDYDETLLQIVNFTSGGFNDGSKIIWTNVAIPAHSYKLFFINVTVNKDISNGTIIYNTANYSYNEGSGEITEETTILAYEIEDPKIAIDLNGAPLVPGDELEYRIWINNTGGIDVENGEFVDVIPESTTYVANSAYASFGSILYDSINNSIIWSGSIPRGSSLFISFRVTINNVPSGTIISNQGFLYYENNTDPTDDPSTPPIDDPTNVTISASSISIEKTDYPDPVSAGGELTYTIWINNTGDAPAYNITVYEEYDANFTFISSSPAPTTGNNQWLIPVIEAGGSFSIVINGLVADNGEDYILNTASFTYEFGEGVAEETTAVIKKSIEIAKSAPLYVSAGSLLNYTITYTNTGSVELSNITITETYPSNTTFVSANPMPDNGNNVWHIDSLLPGESGTITITLLVDSPLPNNTLLINYVEITSNETIDNATSITYVQSSPHLLIGKTDYPDPVEAGNQLTYTINVTNDGNENAYDVIVTDVFDALLNITYTDGGTINGNEITWNVPLLRAGESIQLTIIATVKYIDYEATIQNYVNATCNKSYAEYTETTTITPPPYMGQPILEIIKDDVDDPVLVNEQITYKITVKNIGDGDATNVIVKDLLGNLTFISASPAPVSINNNSIEWHFDSLAVGEIVELTVYAKASSAGIYNNTAIVTCGEGVYDEDIENTTVVEDNEPPHTWKVFHGKVKNVSIWGIYILHYIPESTYITLATQDYPLEINSGVNITYYRIWKWDDNASKWKLIFDWKEYNNEKIYLYNLAGYGKYEIEFYSIDRDGNKEEMEWNDVYVYKE